MAAPVSDDDHKRRARRRLIGAVALTIVAVILLPLVLEDEPPPAGPLEVHMPHASSAPAAEAGRLEYAPPPANASVEPPDGENADARATPLPAQAPLEPRAPSPLAARKEPVAAAPAAKPRQPATTAPAGHYTVQVGVFADQANVARLKARIAALGLQSYTEQTGHATRLRVGSFPSRDDAERAAAKLQKADIPAKVIEK